MSCIILGSKPDSFERHDQAWYWLCTTDPPTSSDVTIEVGDMSFHLHKYPLQLKSGVLGKVIEETLSSSPSEKPSVIELSGLPGGARAFELVARFCYGVELEINVTNSILLRCAAQHLDMSEEVYEGNLIALTEVFLSKFVLRSWKDSVKALQSCEEILPYCENLGVVERCIDYLAVKACTNSLDLIMESGGVVHGPRESVLWNGICIEAQILSPDWWYDDVTSLDFSMFSRLLEAVKSRGISQEHIAGLLTHFGKKSQKLSLKPRTHAAQN